LRVSRPLCADGESAIFCVDYLPAKLIAEAGYQPEDLEPPISHFLNKSAIPMWRRTWRSCGPNTGGHSVQLPHQRQPLRR